MENEFKKIIKFIKNLINKIGLKKIIYYSIGFFIILIVLIFLGKAIEKKSFEKDINDNQYITSDDFKSVREYVVYAGHTYVKEEYSKEKDIFEDIYVQFKEKTHESNTINDVMYNDAVEIIAKILNYNNFRIIDKKQELVISVVCNKENKTINNVYYNGEENYFENLKAKNELQNYDQIKNTDFEIQSSLLKNIIEQNWKTGKVKFDKKINVKNKYDIYDKYMVKTCGNKVYNIVFNEKYDENIINGLNVKTSKEDIEKELGNPYYEYDDIVGYKGNEVYVFFINNTVSIYRVEKYTEEFEEFLNIIENFREDKNSGKLASSITDLWNDYNEFSVENGKINIEYALRGVQIQFNIGRENGIILYNNYIGDLEKGVNYLDIKDNKDYTMPKYTFVKVNEDLVFNSEIQRAFMFSEINS